MPQSILSEHEFSTDGKTMGTGSLYGMPVARSSMIEVYYNRSLLPRFGGVPKTYNDFVAELAKAKAAGITPIAMGNVEQVGVTTPLYSVMNALGDQKTISNLIYSHGTSSISDPKSGFPQAVSALSDWAKKGYFTGDFGAVAGSDAAQDFVDGKALFHFDYSGSLPLKAGQDKQFGSFILPRNDGTLAVATMSSATNFLVSCQVRPPGRRRRVPELRVEPRRHELATDLGADRCSTRTCTPPAPTRCSPTMSTTPTR